VAVALLEPCQALPRTILGARLSYTGGVHSVPPLVTVGRVPGCVTTRGAVSLSDTSIIEVYLPEIYH
jgi:hypothetical protein